MKKIKIMIIIALFIFTIMNIFITPVNATLWFMGFEGSTVGQQYGDSDFYTALDYNEGLGYQVAYCYDNLPFYGTRDYYIFFEDYYLSRPNICSFYYNYTSATFLTYFKMYVRQYADCNGEWTYYHFRNNASEDLINIRIGLSNPLSYYQYQDFDGTWIQAGTFYTLSGYDYVGWELLANDTVKYFTYYNTTTDTPRTINNSNMRIIKTKIDSQETGSRYKFLIDNINYETGIISGIPTNETATGYYTINFRLHNIATGNILYWKGKNVSGGQWSVMGTRDYTDCYLLGLDFPTGYANNNYYYTESFPITFNFTEGSYYDFMFTNSMSFTDFLCNIGDSDIFFKAKLARLKVYSGQTYDIYLEPTWFSDGVNYNYCGGNDITGGYVSVCLTKQIYDFGETVRMQYTLPTSIWLQANGWLTHGWYFAFFDTSEYFLGARLNDDDYIHRYEIGTGEFDGGRHTYEFEIQELNEHGYEHYFEKYEVCIINYESGWFDKHIMFDRLFYYCSGDDYLPNGTIDAISPNPAYFGEPVTITFTSNGKGRLEINYPSGDTYFSQEYGYSDAVHSITKTMTGIGTFSIELYTYSVLAENTTLPVDTDYLTVNPLGTNGSYGSYGYGVPYLYIPLYRAIAGYDTVQIFYRTYKNDSRLNITSPRGETTYFSTTVSNESDNVLSIAIPNYMMIGTWNVSLEGADIYGVNEMLYTSFNVVNEENNWVEFNKHIYNTNEGFALYIKHSYRVSLTFYKDEIAQGESIILNVGEYDNELYPVPIEKIQPTIGTWRVEMWRINDRNTVYELAEWNCIVVYAPPVVTPSYGTLDLATIPVMYKIIISLLIILLCTVSPLFLGLALGKANVNIDIPSLVYVAFFFFGMIISVLLGVLDVVYIFTVLFALVMVTIILWIKEKKVSEG